MILNREIPNSKDCLAANRGKVKIPNRKIPNSIQFNFKKMKEWRGK
jgi:hypothetical protein